MRLAGLRALLLLWAVSAVVFMVFASWRSTSLEILLSQPVRIPRSVVFVVTEFGVIGGETGMGRANFLLAKLFLSFLDLSVTVLYVSNPQCPSRMLDCDLAHWSRAYREMGFRFESLQQTDSVQLSAFVKRSWKVCQWLRKHEAEHDIAVFEDYGAVGFYSTQAKRVGLAFKGLSLIVLAHGSHRIGARSHDWSPSFVHLVQLEEAAIAQSDVFHTFLSSRRMMYKRFGIELPDTTSTMMYPVTIARILGTHRKAEEAVKKDIVVFFGKLNEEKGLRLFMAAIEKMVDLRKAPTKVVIIGKIVDGDMVPEIRRWSRQWNQHFKTVVLHGLTVGEAQIVIRGLGNKALLIDPSLYETVPVATAELIDSG